MLKYHLIILMTLLCFKGKAQITPQLSEKGKTILIELRRDGGEFLSIEYNHEISKNIFINPSFGYSIDSNKRYRLEMGMSTKLLAKKLFEYDVGIRIGYTKANSSSTFVPSFINRYHINIPNGVSYLIKQKILLGGRITPFLDLKKITNNHDEISFSLGLSLFLGYRF